MNQTLIFCDADETTGLGHLGRCLGVAELGIECGEKVRFLGSFMPQALTLIHNAGGDAISVPSSMGLLRSMQYGHNIDGLGVVEQGATSAVLIDSYELTEAELDHARTLWPDAFLAVMDDQASLSTYDCDAVVNFTIDADVADYPAQTPLRLGPGYFPARRWLRQLSRRRRPPGKTLSPKRFFVFAGGMDHQRIAMQLTRAVFQVVPKAEAWVVARNPTDDAELRKLGSVRIDRILGDPSAPMEWADICLCGGGLLKYECAYAGLPVAALSQNDRQHRDTIAWRSTGRVGNLGLASQTASSELQTNLRDWLASIRAVRSGQSLAATTWLGKDSLTQIGGRLTCEFFYSGRNRSSDIVEEAGP